MMKYTTETSYRVHYHDLEAKIKEEYGHELCIPADEECGNDVILSRGGKKEPLDEYDMEDVDNFRANGSGQYILQTLIMDMINRDVIPEGDWLVNVSW